MPVTNAQAASRVDPDLRARIEHMAAASGSPVPRTLPGAAATLLPLALPLSSAKARRDAARFAFETHLANTLDTVVVAVGPRLSESVWLCAATDTLHAKGDAPLIPDLHAVPVPPEPEAWALWWGRDMAYIRFADGGGLCVDKGAFEDLWIALGRPRIMLYFGTPAPHIPVTPVPLPELDLAILQLDLRGSTRRMSRNVVRRLGFATVLGLATAFAHGALLSTDAQVLGRLADERSETVAGLLKARGISATGADPLPVIAVEIERRTGQGQGADPFLVMLAQLAAGLEGERIGFRNMRYVAEQGSLTLQAMARDLPTLQAAEDSLVQAGLRVQSGSAAQVASGAEVQLIVSSL